MDCPEKWEMVGNALMNIQHSLMTERVVAALALISSEVRRLGFEKGLPFLCGLERKERAQASLTARRIVRPAGPLDVRELEAVWLLLRCQCACDFLGQMHPPLARESPVPETDWTPEATAEWLLTELWERRHDSWLKLVAMEWAGPFPFYGIEAAPEWL